MLRMSDEAPGEAEVDQFIVYVGYGQVMHQLQVLELALWGFLTRGIKSGTSLDQGISLRGSWRSATIWRIISSESTSL